MKFIIAALFFISTLGLLSTAFADKVDPNVSPCKEDVQKFCKDVKRGGGAIMRCMKSHEAELSQSCKDHRLQRMEQRKARRGR